MPKFAKHLKKGEQATERYPWRRYRDWKKSAKNGSKSAEILGLLGGLFIAGNLADTAFGGCSDELESLKNSAQRFTNNENVGNCQDFVDDTLGVLSCAGLDEGTNVTRNMLYCELCSTLKN